ncbi:hypothetical protein RB628_13860 [Streptomyces sp. ADMS]|uniref:hypothetical protein n=1 Tax=Streptomyces sp. ADMS TaxID=3071415 RepID=UPI00296F1302|nr:hypothetical protein [Streptomyces sp. ADMS]MDW4906393.1 hypothetical protein [Streptomyces sp. ADMS]
MLGFIREVTARIGAAQRTARAAAEEGTEADGEGMRGRSVALALADRTTVVEARLAAQYPRLNKTRPTKFKGTGVFGVVADFVDDVRHRTNALEEAAEDQPPSVVDASPVLRSRSATLARTPSESALNAGTLGRTRDCQSVRHWRSAGPGLLRPFRENRSAPAASARCRPRSAPPG